MVPFNYHPIGRSLIEQTTDRILSGESIILLGPRYCGKRHVMYRTRKALEDASALPIVQLKLLSEPPVTSEDQLRVLIEHAAGEAAARLDMQLSPGGPRQGELFGPIDEFQEQTKLPVVLMASNPDSMAHHMAQRFLEAIRTRVEAKHLIVLLTGENDLRDLVYGPKGEFNCANQYVLSNYDIEEFKEYLFRYTRNMRLEFEAPAEAAARLWEQTGGNVYLMRMVLWSLIELRARRDIASDGRIKTNDIPYTLKSIGIPGVYGTHVYRHATQVVKQDPTCWPLLEKLINEGEIVLGVEESAPSVLELSGIAVRNVSRDAAKLTFASPLIASFVRQYYKSRRFGDLYAGVFQWKKAFAYYSSLPPEEKLRPLGANDLIEVEATVTALCAALYAEATKVESKEGGNYKESVVDLYADGCRHVLGFSEVTFWQRNMANGGSAWELIDSERSELNQQTVKLISDLIPISNQLLFGEHPIPEPWSRHAILGILPAIRGDQRIAVVSSNIEPRIVLSRERAALSKRLLKHFVKSYSHANTVDGLGIRLKVRDEHVQIMNSVFDSLGKRDLNVEGVLHLAAQGLSKLEYKHVFFSLVDSPRRQLRGVLSSDAGFTVEDISWPLDDGDQHIHSNVAREKKAKIIYDIRNERLADARARQLTHGVSLAVAPILTPANDVIGTIQVERGDGAAPSWDDANDLVAFGKQLAIAIEQIERVNILEKALDKIPEPIILVDRAAAPLFANRPAAELFAVTEGWRERDDGGAHDRTDSNGHIKVLVGESLLRDRRLVSHRTGVGTDSDYRGAVLSDVIKNWKDETVGGLLHIQKLNYLDKVFKASNLIGAATDTESAMRAMLKAVELLGHEWGRLYLVGEETPDLFISALSFGYKEDEKEHEQAFNNGDVILASRNQVGPSYIDWLCVEKEIPLVFCWRDADPPGEIITKHGLKAINVHDPVQPAEVRKQPGDFWIDFPLITRQRVLGKLCLQGDEDLRPEDFELLKILSETAAGLFDAFLERARVLGNREEMIKVRVAEKIMAAMAHNMASRLASLPILLSRYVAREGAYPELKDLNKRFEHLIEHTLSTIKRAKELLAPVIPRLSEVDLPDHIARTLSASLPDDAWRIECSEHPLRVQIDEHLFSTALLELVQNSRDATPDDGKLLVTVTVESATPSTDDEQWVRIIYRDNGPGVPSEINERIFKDFFSYRPGRKTGTGFGMGFVRRTIVAHGGFIYTGLAVQGAEFVIALPKTRMRPSEEEDDNVPYPNR